MSGEGCQSFVIELTWNAAASAATCVMVMISLEGKKKFQSGIVTRRICGAGITLPMRDSDYLDGRSRSETLKGALAKFSSDSDFDSDSRFGHIPYLGIGFTYSRMMS